MSLLAELRGLGLRVELVPGGLRLSGLDHLTKGQAETALNLARTRKGEIIRALAPGNSILEQMPDLSQNLQELFEERVAIPLEEVKQHKAEALVHLRLLQTPLNKLEAPLLIESDVVEGRFSLVANEVQAAEVQEAGGVAYLPSEIRSIMATSAGMDGNTMEDYLKKLHEVKKTFRGARIQ